MGEFINRDEELTRLQQLYASDSAELAVVWGRRRIGKTRLIAESIRVRDDAVYHQATETTAKSQLDAFVADARETYPDIERLQRDWETLLEYLIAHDAIIVCDEFPYLADADSELPSLIQRWWDPDVDHGRPRFGMTYDNRGEYQVPGEKFDTVVEIFRLNDDDHSQRGIADEVGEALGTIQNVLDRRDWYMDRAGEQLGGEA